MAARVDLPPYRTLPPPPAVLVIRSPVEIAGICLHGGLVVRRVWKAQALPYVRLVLNILLFFKLV